MRNVLIGLFSLFLILMLATTIYASLDRNVFNVGKETLSDRWFQATLLDAYLAFLTFYVWVAYKEASWISRVIWLVLILFLGTIAIASYVLLQLRGLQPTEPVANMLVRRAKY